jgi:Sec-independent protein secretion pathway component TatC
MMAFFASFNGADLAFMPRLEDTFGLYTKMLIGMGLVFQMPTVVFFLAKMGLVSARWLWSNIKYAILIIFILAAALTPSTDPWNQTIFAAPMIGLYLICIVIAWIVGPKHEKGNQGDSTRLRLVFAATVIDQARRGQARGAWRYAKRSPLRR